MSMEERKRTRLGLTDYDKSHRFLFLALGDVWSYQSIRELKV